jgi:hypothetical protein
MWRTFRRGWFHGFVPALVAVVVLFGAPVLAAPNDYYGLQIVDQATGRGVANVELVTAGGSVKYYTDSNGWAAIDNSTVVNKPTVFSLFSFGYSPSASVVTTTLGARNTVSITRTNKAERLYRITGQGIYDDSVKLGVSYPIANPLINANVTGQDSVQSALYKGNMFWTWGDTLSPDPNVFNLRTSGATSQLPGQGGLQPGQGVNLSYYTNNNGFVKQMMPINEPGFLWMDALTTVHDTTGAEKLISHYSRMQDLGTRLEHGIAVFNDSTSTFGRLTPFSNTSPIDPVGHSFARTENGQEYLYFTAPYPNVRVKSDWNSINNPAAYETYTPLKANTTYDVNTPQFDRDAQNKLIWGWKTNTPTWKPQMQIDQVNAGRMARADSPFRLKNMDTGGDVWLQSSSVYWNNFLQKYLMIGEEAFGSSWLGEIYGAVADSPEGPWVNAEKLVTHAATGDRPEYAFYNVMQQPLFDEAGGRLIYFEGTYTRNLYGDNHAFDTPLYEYNQVMYRLDLAATRLPEPGCAGVIGMVGVCLLRRGRRVSQGCAQKEVS